MSRYVSPLREAQAAQTRLRILDAAVAVFGARGYSGTSLAQIAKEAGVSLETVKQNGPKAALLLSAFGHAFSGADDDRPLHERPVLDEVLALPDDAFMTAWIAFVADGNARVARLWPRLLDAALGDADVGARLEALQANRRADMSALIAQLRTRGLCRSPRDDAELAAAISFLISPEGYAQLVLESGLDHDAYRRWVLHAVERVVLSA
ncbi:TetR/AcrR family transcriptional regulator [Microbacterium sp. No. 7]|uniref:TetR/AcrR family transcriptional regulator n=1 Tax=Microbacterium sp. No. 7 TaxID=1714373 RepID=UPI0006D05E54|nr:TetR/AcrR family transcriptional regulator [Microbacterium sp. No. 7]ALJ18752.1 hypothetical protein AOA12_02015 [Microbacterium sp. No. 7]